MIETEQMGIVPEFNNNMRTKNFLRATLLAATLVVAGYGGMKAYDYSYARRVNRMSRLMMENVEALTTDGEDVPQLPCDPETGKKCEFNATSANGQPLIIKLDDMVKKESNEEP